MNLPAESSLREPSSIEFTWISVLTVARKRWWIPLIAFCLGVGGALGFLAVAVPTYTVTMRVMPGNSSSLKSLSGAKSMGASLLLGTSTGSLEFQHYLVALRTVAASRALMVDPEISRVIFTKQWDAHANRFRPIHGLGLRLLAFLDPAAGFQAGYMPSAVTLRKVLDDAVVVTAAATDADTDEISVRWRDPKFAIKLLMDLHTAANEIVRENDAENARKMVDYLQQQLRGMTVGDERAALISLLVEQEKKLALAQPGMPYAAVILDPPTASDLPTFPKPALILAIGGVFGAGVGLLYLLLIEALAAGRQVAAVGPGGDRSPRAGCDR